MKKELELAKPIIREDQLTLKFGKSEVLNLEAMNCIRGGYDEGNGGGWIVLTVVK